MTETCWNCGGKASVYLPEYTNNFCDDCKLYFDHTQEEEMTKRTKGGYF